MYCRKCGNKTGDTDHYCQVCGTPTGYSAPDDAPAEPIEMKEEIVFNPPYENKSHFVKEPHVDEEEPAESKEEEEDLREFISDNEIEEQKKEEETGKLDPSKDSEFEWNIYEFPSRKKTEEIAFNWNMEDFNQPGPKEAEPVSSFEEEFFQEIREDSNRIKEQNIDRFFTFSRKNEEFQELLDREYEKLNARSEPDRVITESGISEAVSVQEIPVETKAPVEIKEPAETEVPIVIEAPVKTEAPEKTEMPEGMPEAAAPKAEHLSEMAMARAQFFGDELIRDNESIKKQLETEPEEEAEPTEPEVECAPEEEDAPEPVEATVPTEEPKRFPQIFDTEREAADLETEAREAADLEAAVLEETDLKTEGERIVAPIPFYVSEAEQAEPVELEREPVELEQEEEVRPRRGIGQILLIILAVILFIEIVILGIRYFAPESGAAKAIGNTQTQIFEMVSGWTDEIKGSPDVEEPDQNNPDQEEPSGEQPEEPAVEKPAPDPNPTADKNALISSQMGNNNNIVQVKANEALAWQQGKDYGMSDINNSKPITNNIWQTPENGEPVYYDESIVGTIIAFDSQWIDYVNDGSKSVLELLKKDSEAYRKTLAFSKLGKIKETFQLLEVGEIRQGAKGFYVWVHEEIQITENGKTTDKKYNWVYYLEPSDGKMQIVNYFNFK